jgi:uncharacterized phiE125 gp8 family phage protein
MTSRLIVPPAALAVSLDAARRAARVDTGPDGTSSLDEEIAQAVRTYTGKAEHLTNRVFITQTWRETFDAFPSAIELPKARLQSIVHVKFYDTAGAQQLLDPGCYLADAESEPGFVVPAAGYAWPATAARINAVEVQYAAGYGADDSAVPDVIKGYILACVQQQFAPAGTSRVEEYERLLDSEVVY